MKQKKYIFAASISETPRSSSWPRTSGFHPEDQGFESPTRYKPKRQLFANKTVGVFAFMVLARIWRLFGSVRKSGGRQNKNI